MSHPNTEGQCQCDKNPFKGLLISDNSVLNSMENRYPCQQCSKSRKYFCYSCFIPHPDLIEGIPRVAVSF